MASRGVNNVRFTNPLTLIVALRGPFSMTTFTNPSLWMMDGPSDCHGKYHNLTIELEQTMESCSKIDKCKFPSGFASKHGILVRLSYCRQYFLNQLMSFCWIFLNSLPLLIFLLWPLIRTNMLFKCDLITMISTRCYSFCFYFTSLSFWCEHELNAKNFSSSTPTWIHWNRLWKCINRNEATPPVTYSSRTGYAIIDSKFNMSFYVSWK